MNVQYILSVIYLGLENLAISASFNGWTFLTPILKIEGHFSTLCETIDNVTDDQLAVNAQNRSWNSNSLMNASSSSNVSDPDGTLYPTCIPQTEVFNLIFTLTTIVQKLAAFTGGIIFQRFGTWMTRIIACVICAGGQLFLAISSVDQPEFLFPGMLCLSASGSMFFMLNMQAGNLFPKARSTIISTLVGLFLSGSVVFWVVGFAYDRGVSLSTVFYFLASLSLISFFATFLLTSRRHFPNPLPDNFKYGIVDIKNILKTNVNADNDDSLNGENNLSSIKKEKSSGFFTSIRTTFFWTNAVQLIIMNLRNEFFQGTFDSWAESVTNNEEELDQLTNVFGIILLCGGIAAPLSGIVVDALKQSFGKTMNNERLIDLKALSVSSALLSCIGILFSVSQCIPGLIASYVSLPLYVLFRVSIYSNCSIAIATYFPSKNFGTLYGITLILGGIVSLLRYPLLSLVLRHFAGNFTEVNVILLSCCFLTFVHPINVWRLYRRKASREEVEPDSKEVSRKELEQSSACNTVSGLANPSYKNDSSL